MHHIDISKTTDIDLIEKIEIFHKYIYDSLFILFRKLTQIISVPRRKYSVERKYVLFILIVHNLNINFTRQVTDKMSIIVNT